MESDFGVAKVTQALFAQIQIQMFLRLVHSFKIYLKTVYSLYKSEMFGITSSRELKWSNVKLKQSVTLSIQNIYLNHKWVSAYDLGTYMYNLRYMYNIRELQML